MRILLINPSIYQTSTGQYSKAVETERGAYPPLGLLYIAAVLEKNGHRVAIVDIDIEEEKAEKKLRETYQDLNPQMVGFYSMTWTYRQAKAMAKRFKEINPKIITVLGGPNVTSIPKTSLELGDFDFGVIGEGEKTIIELVDKLEGKNNLEFDQIQGIAFKKDGEIFINPLRPLICDMNSIPLPARHLISVKKYSDVFSKRKHFTTTMATRGCPFNCTFCDRKNRMGRTFRVRSPENIAYEIKKIIKQYNIREFMFFDDNLIIDKQWGLELCQKLKPLNIIWECRNRVNLLDEEILTAMKKSGCYRIRLGFESGDNYILKVLKKDITVEQSLECARLCKKIGIEIYGYFIMGAPEETPQTVEKTIDLALKINPSFAIFSKIRLTPGSELFDYGVETGQINKNHWEKYLSGEETNGAPSLSSQQLPEKLVDEYIKKANRKFYFRASYILKRLFLIKSLRHLISQTRIGFALIFKN